MHRLKIIFLFLLLTPHTYTQSVLGSFDNDGISHYLYNPNTTHRIPIKANGRLRWMQHRTRARNFVLRNELEQARLSYSSLLKTKSNSLRQRTISDLHLELGQVYHLLGDTDSALIHYEKARSFGPQAYQPHVRLGQLTSSLGHINKALEHYKNALFFNNTHRVSLHNIGSLSFVAGNLETGLYYWGYAIVGHHPMLSSPTGSNSVVPTTTTTTTTTTTNNNNRKNENNPVHVSWNQKVNLISWMTHHIMEVFVSNQPKTDLDRTPSDLDIRYYYLLLNMDETDRYWICGHVLHEIASMLARLGLDQQSERLYACIRSDIFSNSLSFIPIYATLPSKKIDIVLERMEWGTKEIKRVLNLRNTDVSVIDIVAQERISYVRLISHFNPLALHLLHLRHHLTSSYQTKEQQRFLLEKMVQWSTDAIQYHWVPPLIYHRSEKEKRKQRRDQVKEKRRKKRLTNNINNIKKKAIQQKPTFIQLGIVYDIDRYNENTEIYRHVALLLESLVHNKRFQVTLYIPRKDMDRYGHDNTKIWNDNSNGKSNDEMNQRHLPTFAKYVSAIVEIPFLHQVILRKLEPLQNEYTKFFFKTDDHGILRPVLDIVLLAAPLLDDTLHYIGHSRVAPFQIGISCGTPTSSLGDKIGHLDYFLEGDIILRKDASQSYTEQLVRLPYTGSILPVAMQTPPVKYQFGSLILFGRYRYAIVLHSSIHGISPFNSIFDNTIINILQQSKNTHVLFVDIPNRGSSGITRQETTLGHNIIVDRIRSKISNRNNVDENEGDRKRNKDKERDARSMRKRVRHITGLHIEDYLALISVVSVILDPGNENGGGSEASVLSTLDVLRMGTPLVTMHPVENQESWQRLQPTSSVAGLIQSIGGNEQLIANCLATNLEEYVNKSIAFLHNDTRSKSTGNQMKKKTKTWLEMQNKKVDDAMSLLLVRLFENR